MNTKRAKRWNGNLDTLTVDYLKDVIEKMEAYGNRVQFELPGKGPRPNYQVINTAGKKMAFDKKNLLLAASFNEEIGTELSSVFTLDMIKAAVRGGGVKTAARARVVRSSTGSTTSRSAGVTEQAVDVVERDKYAYFKANRETLPDGIQKHSQKISELMRGGMSAESAFDEVIKQHF